VADRGQDRLKKVVRLKMTSKGRVCLRLADVKRYRVPILGAATWKARSPNERLCHGTESKWLADERVDLAGLWYCM